MSDRLLIVDFGSQVTQLIARRLREAGVYCEIHPFQSVDQAKIEQFGPKAIVLSGGPASVIEGQAPAANPAIFAAKVPVLGICYGEQTMAQQLGGTVESGHHREFGRAQLEVKSPSALFDGVWQPGDKKQVWMSHGDRVTKLPPGFSVIATSENAPFAAISDEARKYYGVQFHPEVMHTPDGAKLLRNFALKIAGFKGDWTMHAFKERAIAQVRAQVGKSKVICGLSGGVDSSVVAVLLHEAIG
ncbi:MAG: glutamine-hydrolyzing GMP synthase, partial [Reyranella sp.]